MPAQTDQQQLARELVKNARAHAELFDAPPLPLTMFANDEGHDGLVQAQAQQQRVASRRAERAGQRMRQAALRVLWLRAGLEQ
jgi:hypothetical protein